MLKEEIRTVIGNRRKFILLRIADIDPETARRLCNIKKGTYNSWLQDSKFVAIYRRRDEFSAQYKQEAIQLLRRDNQLSAVLLEGKIIAQMKEELESGDYLLLRTNLAREVYSKLIADLDYQPQVQNLTWEQRVQQLFVGENKPQLEEGGVIEGEFTPDSEPSPEHQKGEPVKVSEQAAPQVEESIQD